MTCPCNASIIHSWVDPKSRSINRGFVLRDQQLYMAGDDLKVKGTCRNCGRYLEVTEPQQALSQFFVIPVVKQETVAVSVKVRC